MKRSVKYIVSVGCLSVMLNACAVQETTTLQEGRMLEEQGDYIGALEYYEQMPDKNVAEICSHNLRALYGDILENMEHLQAHPDDADSLYALGYAHYEKARSLPIESEIEDNVGFDTRTYFFEQRDIQYARSAAALDSATAVQPDHVRALYLKGTVYEDTAQFNQAIDTYQHVLDLQPHSLEATLRLANMLYKQGKTENGRQIAEHAVDMAPDASDAHLLLGTMYAQEGRVYQAMTEFQEVLCLNPHVIDGYHRLAQLHLELGEAMNAARVLFLGRKHNPDSLFLSIQYTSLNSTLEQQEIDRFLEIMSTLVEEIVENFLTQVGQGKGFEPTAGLEVQYLRLQQDIIRRRQPYYLPCSGKKENPFFEKQLVKLQKKIDEFMESDAPRAEEASQE